MTDQCPITSEPMGGGRRVVGTVGNARGGLRQKYKVGSAMSYALWDTSTHLFAHCTKHMQA